VVFSINIAIVGTSHLNNAEQQEALMEIRKIIEQRKENDLIITGDAEGIDSLVSWECLEIPHRVYEAKVKGWANEGGFKDRNIRIAENSDYVYSITTRTKDEECYHCNLPHQRTGGCWTLKYANSIGKKGSVIII